MLAGRKAAGQGLTHLLPQLLWLWEKNPGKQGTPLWWECCPFRRISFCIESFCNESRAGHAFVWLRKVGLQSQKCSLIHPQPLLCSYWRGKYGCSAFCHCTFQLQPCKRAEPLQKELCGAVGSTPPASWLPRASFWLQGERCSCVWAHLTPPHLRVSSCVLGETIRGEAYNLIFLSFQLKASSESENESPKRRGQKQVKRK